MRAVALGRMQAGTACCAPTDLLGTWKRRDTACRTRSSRSSTWLLKYVVQLMIQGHLGGTNRFADGAHLGRRLRQVVVDLLEGLFVQR